MTRSVLLVLAALSTAAQAQSPARPAPLNVGKAELMNTIKSADLKAGDLFYLRTLGPWKQGDCTLPPNTTITGHVTNTASSGHSILAMRFTPVPCSGSEPVLMTPVLVAVRAPSDMSEAERERYGSGAAQKNELAGLFPSGYGDVRSSNSPMANSAADSGLSPSMMNALRAGAAPEKPLKTGEVRGFRGIDLDLPRVGEPISTLSSAHKFALDRYTQFALLYFPVPPAPSDVAASTPDPAPVKAPPPPPEEMEDVCASGCKQLAAAPDSSSAHALWTVPLAVLGYQPRPRHEVIGLDHSAGVHFLGDNQILLTFTLHTLVPRSGEQNAWTSNPRSVRGVLISSADGHILRIKDWTVSDDLGPFVWYFGNHLVLAHVGHDLVLLGPDLSIQKRFPLAGPLLFVSAAPQGNLLLAATLHEKHTRQEHAKIAAFLGPGLPVDEDYDLTGLNAALEVTGSKRVTIKPTRPALLQSTMVSARPIRPLEWLIERSTWEGESKPLAHFRSSCEVQVQSLPGDLLLAQGCPVADSSTAWYRVLNARGAVLLKGNSPYGDLLQQAETSPDGKLFAVASSHFDHPVSLTSTVHTGDFANLTVTLYNTTTGKQFFAARLPQGSAEKDTFSLAPSGSTLAVLTSSSLQSFSLLPSK